MCNKERPKAVSALIGRNASSTVRAWGPLLAMLALLICSEVPFVLERGSVRWSQFDVLTLEACGFALLMCLPLLARAIKPRLVSFKLTWFHSWRRELCHVLLLTVCTLAWISVSGWALSNTVGWRPYKWIQPSHRLWAPDALVLMAILGIVVAPMAEEIFWRGYVVDQLTGVLGSRPALFAQAAAFGLAHFRPLAQSLIVVGVGLIFGGWRQKKRCLLPLIVAHVLVNAVAIGPPALASYRESRMLLRLDQEGIGNFQTLFKGLQNNPEVHKIDALRFQPDRIAVPAIIQYLGSSNDSVRIYAGSVLLEQYGKKGCNYYREALHSRDQRIVFSLIGVIGASHCSELVPDIRSVVMKSNDRAVQIGGVAVLEEFGDVAGLNVLAREGRSAYVRRMAEQSLRSAQQTATWEKK
jgi:membrane protease YdiL (CAAX protease family)